MRCHSCCRRWQSPIDKKAAPQFRNEIRSRQQLLSEVQSRRYKKKIYQNWTLNPLKSFLKAGFCWNKKYPLNEKIWRPCLLLKSGMKLPEWKKTVNFGEFLPHFAHPFHAHKIDLIYNLRYITDPAKSKTDSWANVYRDGRSHKLELQVRRPTKSFPVAF